MAAQQSKTDRGISVGDLIAGLVSLGAAIGFLILAWALPAGISRGDSGPGALPIQVGFFAIICAVFFLIAVLKGAFLEEKADFSNAPKAMLALAIFVICLFATSWVGLALTLSLASGLMTLLFPGEKLALRAVLTALGIWIISVGLFEKLLGVPMP